jgi:hypothetical protein
MSNEKSKQIDKPSPNVMIGKWFHSFNNGIVRWQGRILAAPSDGLYLVQLYSWVMGEETDQVLVPLADMKDWSFYSSSEDMGFAYEYRYRHKVEEYARANP